MDDLLPIPNVSKGSPALLGFSSQAHLLSKIFPFFLAFDREMQVVLVGEALQKLYSTEILGSPVQQYFKLNDSRFAFDFDSLSQQSGMSIGLESLQSGLQLQGQMMYAAQQQAIFFLGNPLISEIDSLLSLGIKLSNTAVQDSTADLLFLLQARSASLSDTRRLAEKLTEQRAELHRALCQAELATAVLEQAADAIEITDADSRILYVNSAFEKITGYSREEVIGKTPASLFQAGQHEDSFYEEISQKIAAGHTWHGFYLGKRKDGSFYHQEATFFPVHNQQNQITNYVAIKRDISDRKQTQTKLEHSLSLLKATFEATADAILVIDIRGKVLHFNQKFVDLWQIPNVVQASHGNQHVMRWIERCLKDPKSFSAQKLVELYVRPHLESHGILELKDGRIFERYLCPQRLDEVVIGWVWSFRDITERQRTEERIRYQAQHDMLTNLPNRLLFHDRLSHALSQAERAHSHLGVLFLDLDRFKLINDTLGHAIGDLLLQEFAQRIRSCLRGSDTVARWAGDEFTVLLPAIHGMEETTAIAQRILDALKPDFKLEGHTLRVSSSIGIAMYPNDGDDVETLLKNADAALYRAKEAGRNRYHLYTSTLNSEASELLALENQLHRALERQEFVLFYQPQVDVVTGEILQMEALIRWQHPEMGLVHPGKFIPLAEENGLIIQIGEWVLRTACEQNRAWQDAGFSQIRVGVNLSGHQFIQPQMVEMVERVLWETRMEPQFLELEITETTMMKHVEMTRNNLETLHQMGVSIALDDFGTGYASLSYLKKFPFHTLKIDQSFVRDLTTDPNDEAIVTAIIAMGKVLKLHLVAEGVETREQQQALQILGCERMQGFLFSRPLPPEAAAKLLKDYPHE